MSTPRSSDVQVLFVEMQPAIVASSRTQDPGSLKRAAAAAERIAGVLAIPTMASGVRLGDEKPTLIEELGSLDIKIRSTISVLADDECRERLAGNARQTIALAGVSSEIAVLRTALDARRAGYEVAVLIDCCGGLSDRTETTALNQMQTAGATITNVSSFFTGLFSDMISADGAAVMGALAELWSWNTAANDLTR